jgi:rod shape-determining protein MreD
MATLLSLPILGILVIVQSAVASRILLLHGTTDLVLLAVAAWALQPRVKTSWQWALVGGLLVSVPSALPLGVPLAGYLAVTGLAMAMRRRAWQYPLLAMILLSILGTIISLGAAWLVLRLTGVPLPFFESLWQVFLPSILLNLLLAIPMYVLAGDLAGWLYPQEIEI